MIYIIIGALLTGLGKAIRDTIAHHWEQCIFKQIPNIKIWFWVMSTQPNKKIIWFLRDGWHFADNVIHYGGITLALYGFSQTNAVFYASVGVFLLITGLTFQLFYKKIFIKKGGLDA